MDAILYWNDVALEANRVSHTNGKAEQTGPPLSARALAIVHLAMYDAFVGTDALLPAPSGLTPYMTTPALPAPPAGASIDAAIATAAHAALSALFPTQRPLFDAKHTAFGLTGTGLTDGHAFGLAVAHRLLEARKTDPSVGDDGYAASVARGAHRSDPDNPQGFHAPFYGAASTLFATTMRYPLNAPYAVSTQPGNYLTSLKQVRAKGIAPDLLGTVPAPGRRTPRETLIGLFWAYDGASGLGTPPRLYNQIVRKVAIDQGNSLAQNADLFARVNTAMADAGILAWEEKYRHDLWRPVVGIREHDPSMGPAGTAGSGVDPNCDPGWLPLGAPATNSASGAKNFTPPFPAYPSGHATFGAAALHVVRLFYGTAAGNRAPDNHLQGLEFVSEELNGVNRDNKGTQRPRHARSFPDGLWQMIIENGLSRIYLGVHWSFDAFALDSSGKPDLTKNVGGVPLGLNIAEDIAANGLVAATAAGSSGLSSPQSIESLLPRKAWPQG